jgi:CRISPR-associated protein Cas1
MVHKNVELRIAQFAAAAADRRSLRLAREFVVGKSKNCRTLLRRHGDDEMQPIVEQLADLGRKAAAAGSAASLVGIEGMAAKEYFAGFGRLLKGGEEFHIDGRNRRPPCDPVNALLSFVYLPAEHEMLLEFCAPNARARLGEATFGQSFVGQSAVTFIWTAVPYRMEWR